MSSIFAGSTTYFAQAGPENTEAAVEAGLARVKALGLRDIVCASNMGDTARAILAGLGKGLAGVKAHEINLVAVTHHVGFRENGGDEMGPAVREELTRTGVRLLTTTHLFGGVERGVSRQSGGLYPAGIIANTLRMFGQGTKVAVEVAVMALDSGLIPYGRDVLALGGSGRGADTALIIRPAHARAFFETKIVETVCRPYPKR